MVKLFLCASAKTRENELDAIPSDEENARISQLGFERKLVMRLKSRLKSINQSTIEQNVRPPIEEKDSMGHDSYSAHHDSKIGRWSATDLLMESANGEVLSRVHASLSVAVSTNRSVCWSIGRLSFTL